VADSTGVGKVSEQEEIKKRELEYSWDGERRREVLIARRMNLDDPARVYRDYGREKLREVFRNQVTELDKLSRNYWKVILGISDEEFNELVGKGLGKDSRVVQLVDSVGAGKVDESEDIKKKELEYSWDGERSREVLIARRMNWDDPVEVYRDYGKEKLIEVFRKELHLLDKVSRSFWKEILGISDEEFNKLTKENFRFRCQIWPY